MPFAFVLDENLRGPLWQAVRRREMRGDDWLDVTCVGEVAELPLGSDDLAVIRWAERTGRLLVTLDRGTMAKHLQTHLASGSIRRECYWSDLGPAFDRSWKCSN